MKKVLFLAFSVLLFNTEATALMYNQSKITPISSILMICSDASGEECVDVTFFSSWINNSPIPFKAKDPFRALKLSNSSNKIIDADDLRNTSKSIGASHILLYQGIPTNKRMAFKFMLVNVETFNVEFIAPTNEIIGDLKVLQENLGSSFKTFQIDDLFKVLGDHYVPKQIVDTVVEKKINKKRQKGR